MAIPRILSNVWFIKRNRCLEGVITRINDLTSTGVIYPIRIPSPIIVPLSDVFASKEAAEEALRDRCGGL